MKKILGLAIITALNTACVSKKVYTELEEKYNYLKDEYEKIDEENETLNTSLTDAEKALKDLKKEKEDLLAEKSDLEASLKTAQNSLDNLKESYNALEKNSSTALAQNARKNKELLAQLEAKEIALNAEKSRLDKLNNELKERSNRVNELEGLIASKDESMRALKDAISKALVNFEGNGLTVEHRDGKVYVSMENKLLFNSGSWTVGPEGKTAVQKLGEVLAQNENIAVLIEGHTDNDPFNGGGAIHTNWDLSTKRATAIVEILETNNNIKPESLTAAGRGEFSPIASNETTEGKAKNRRIEVVLTPKLDEISKLLNEI